MSQKHCPSWSSLKVDLIPGGNFFSSKKARNLSESLLTGGQHKTKRFATKFC